MPCNCDPVPTDETVLIYTDGCTEPQFYRMVRTALPEKAGECGMPVVQIDGSIEYPQGEPPDILGYTRVGRLFRPAWASCRWRTLHVTHPNGCIAVRGCCGFPLSENHLKSVQPEQCSGCPVRQPIKLSISCGSPSGSSPRRSPS
jgi:hypothetical protein